MLEVAQIPEVRGAEGLGDACDCVAVADDENSAAHVTMHCGHDTVDVLWYRAAEADDFGRNSAASREWRRGFDVPLPLGDEDRVDPRILQLAGKGIGSNEASRAEIGIRRILCRLFRVPHDVDDRLAVSASRRNWSRRRGCGAAGE